MDAFFRREYIMLMQSGKRRALLSAARIGNAKQPIDNCRDFNKSRQRAPFLLYLVFSQMPP